MVTRGQMMDFTRSRWVWISEASGDRDGSQTSLKSMKVRLGRTEVGGSQDHDKESWQRRVGGNRKLHNREKRCQNEWE